MPWYSYVVPPVTGDDKGAQPVVVRRWNANPYMPFVADAATALYARAPAPPTTGKPPSLSRRVSSATPSESFGPQTFRIRCRIWATGRGRPRWSYVGRTGLLRIW